nr:CidA/LrgA family protein [Pyruvatibacter mobilis]
MALILAQIIGTAAMQGLGLPIPGPVAGLVLLLGVLAVSGGIPAGLGRLADLLLRHLNLFFVPAGVGLMAHLALLARDGAALTVAIILSTLAGLVVAAAVFLWARNKSSGHAP